MAEKSFPFNSVAKDRIYKAEDFANYFAQFIGTGIIYASANALKVVAAGGMNVILQIGGAFIKGRGYINDTNLQFTLDTADGALNRIDRIVLSCDYSERTISAKVKKGIYGAQPVARELQRDADIYELALADIYIGKGVINISQAVITDQRLNTALCGVVTGLIQQADTTEIFNQFTAYLNEFKTEKETDYNDWAAAQQADFITWVNTIKDVLDETTAGNLQNEIIELQNALENIEIPTSLPANGGTAETISETLPMNKGGTGATNAATARNNLGAAPVNSPAFTGTPTAPVGTDYGTTRVRNAYFSTVVPASMNNGEICFVYE